MNNVILQEGFLDKKTCFQCNEPINNDSRFCNHCGVAQNVEELKIVDRKWGNIKHIALFYLFDIVICCIASNIDAFKTFTWHIVFVSILAIIAVTFFCDGWQKNKTLLAWPKFSFIKLLGYCLLAAVASFIVGYSVDWLNYTIFSKEFDYYGMYSKYRYGEILLIFFVAIMPALFEELAFRGYLLQKLLDISDKKQAIFISAFLFAILHMSFISLFWLMPFALLLGYTRIKENTIWYGVFFHFTFNFTACMLDVYHKIANHA